MTDPTRTADDTHQCCCVWLDVSDPDSGYYTPGADGRCNRGGLPPDQPFCRRCEDRHPRSRRRIGAVGLPGVMTRVDP